MKMSEYLDSIEGAVRPMLDTINASYNSLSRLDIDIQQWIHLENYLLGKEHNGYGPSNFEAWVRDMEEEPTVESVQYWRNQLVASTEATKETINTLCASVLMIAQNGIKLTVGNPNKWASSKGMLLSSQGECLLEAIWHGRNLGAHVEGLSAGKPSHTYFVDLASRRGVNLLDPNYQMPCETIVKDLLGWVKLYDLKAKDTIHDSYPSPFVQDMMRIGTLA
ncbi:hypothetical protein [Vibrio parahaemolyticus]|uniref:hypothetical protein n=1 Tax=Vibrio parahaemolyticus TaxID=670 RepID=UPI003306827C